MHITAIAPRSDVHIALRLITSADAFLFSPPTVSTTGGTAGPSGRPPEHTPRSPARARLAASARPPRAPAAPRVAPGARGRTRVAADGRGRGGSASKQPSAPLAPPPRFSASTAAALFALGATLGTALDGIHTNVQLLQYDFGAVQVGPLSTSAFVPPLLGTFYVVLGFLHGALTAPAGPGAPAGSVTRELGIAAAAFGVLALNLEVSSLLFSAGLPSSATAAALIPLAVANWAAFEGAAAREEQPAPGGLAALASRPALRALALAAVCGAAAPFCELPLMSPASFGLSFPPLWHYTRPDWLPAGSWGVSAGINGFVPLCYFAYVPAVGRLRRALARIEEEAAASRRSS